MRKISVFSNQKTVELIHNGKSLGVREVVNGEAVFAVPFINGENLLDARSGALSDRLKIQMKLLSSLLLTVMCFWTVFVLIWDRSIVIL